MEDVAEQAGSLNGDWGGSFGRCFFFVVVLIASAASRPEGVPRVQGDLG